MLTWAAGFFDGEGNVSAHYAAYRQRGKRYRTIRAQVAQTRLGPLKILKRLFGGYINEINPKGARQRTWVWTLPGRPAVGRMYRKLARHLQVKGPQFHQMMRRYDAGPASIPLES